MVLSVTKILNLIYLRKILFNKRSNKITKSEYKEKLGMPDLEIAGLSIWIHNREFPENKCYWDGNWLNVSVYCEKDSSIVRATGSIIHLSEIEIWLKETEVMSRKLEGESSLQCMEPNLYIRIQMKERVKAEMLVDITADNSNKHHNFIFEIEQSNIPKLIDQLNNVLKKYPVRGSENKN